MVKIDLHLHSLYSDRPSEWILRRLGLPQSYSPAEVLYQKLHAAGMTYKTITDHHRIDGCLELLAKHPEDTFISEEVTTYFPDGCKIHLLVWNINISQHEEINALRENIYELSAYLRLHHIPHAVTHPLISLNQKFTIEHFEKLILLFSTFESINGNREPLTQEIATLCLLSLTPEKIEELANRHNLTPTHPHPHLKSFTAGSDDHGGLAVAAAFTEAPQARTLQEFFQAIQERRTQNHGSRGDPLRLANNVYNTILGYARTKLTKQAPKATQLLTRIVDRFLSGKNPTNFSFSEKLTFATEAIRSGAILDWINPNSASLTQDLATFFSSPETHAALEKAIREEATESRRTFRMASYLANTLIYRFAIQIFDRIREGRWFDALQPLSGFLPVLASIAPYLVAFRQFCPDRPFLQQVSKTFLTQTPETLKRHKTAWFTDTLEDVNGVTRTIRALTAAIHDLGHPIEIISCHAHISIQNLPIRNFPPLGEFPVPEYELQRVSFPPLLDILDTIYTQQFTEIIVSTPGPVGLVGLLAARLLGLPLHMVYHTDFPQYALYLSDDQMMESLTWSYMQWFYGQADRLYVNTEAYRQAWEKRSIPSHKISILPRGIDTHLFHFQKRNADFWKSYGATNPVVLYVGRISKEKNLAFLASVWPIVQTLIPTATLAFVGDGPYRAELQKLIPSALFTGPLIGETLATAYASSDLFLFPSTTDTFGNVVLEALASGLPVICSTIGGPAELLRRCRLGQAISTDDPSSWAHAIVETLHNPPHESARLAQSERIRKEWDWKQAAAQFVQLLTEPIPKA
ncbi:MAG: glycosyltransferase [Methylacidiphilales bacterium]|nr:glycosyltransferase [Candidatus Methylacidiphilales bacterium]MDW8349488.1 glycosyltransferase [Verrucomicrobiae bacterium]